MENYRQYVLTKYPDSFCKKVRRIHFNIVKENFVIIDADGRELSIETNNEYTAWQNAHDRIFCKEHGRFIS